MPKLTKRTIDATEPTATEFFIWDESIPGFGVRVMPSGRKSFVVQYRAGRRPRRMSLGPSTVLTCDQVMSDNHLGRCRQPPWPVGLDGRRACPSGGQPHRPD